MHVSWKSGKCARFTSMEVILLHTPIASLFIFGLWNSFNPSMIFSKFDMPLEKALGWFYKPLIGCSICMPSIWGTAYYFIFVGANPLQWIVFVFALSGFNYFVAQNLIK